MQNYKIYIGILASVMISDTHIKVYWMLLTT